MTDYDLCMSLLTAESEEKVTEVIKYAGYYNDNPEIWRPYGDVENNRSTIHSQQADATPALVEKIVNAVDALLIAQSWDQGIDPESDNAPKSMSEAAELFFRIRNGRLDSVDSTQRTALAENIYLVATGDKSTPCYLVVDRGEGQTPNRMPDTFLSLHKRNKYGIPFTQGINNCGGTGVLPFCGRPATGHGYQLVISHRHPGCPASNDTSRDLWGFTLVRRLRPNSVRPISMYVYLAPRHQVPRFYAEELPVLPSMSVGGRRSEPYRRGLKYGSCIKLYEYQWRARSLATTNAREELENYLYTLCLPVRIVETRDYRGKGEDGEGGTHYYETTLSGLSANVIDQSKSTRIGGPRIEAGFPKHGEIAPEGFGVLPYTIVVYREKYDNGKSIDTRHVPSGLMLTINGQVHARPSSTLRQLHYTFLEKHLLVVVNCDKLPADLAEDLFMTSRDRQRVNEISDTISKMLISELRDLKELRRLNNVRMAEQIKNALTNEEPKRILQKIVESDPSFSRILSGGVDATSPFVPDDIPTLWIGRRFPTIFRIRNEPAKGLVKPCPINKTCRIEFETDAENDYFDRAESPGRVSTYPEGIRERWHLSNGHVPAHFRPPSNAKPGELIDITVRIKDDSGNDFESHFVMRVENETIAPETPSGSDNPKGGKKFALPSPLWVTKDGRMIDGAETRSCPKLVV